MSSERKFSDYQWAIVLAVAAFFLLLTAATAAGNPDREGLGVLGWLGFLATSFAALLFLLRGFFRR